MTDWTTARLPSTHEESEVLWEVEEILTLSQSLVVGEGRYRHVRNAVAEMDGPLLKCTDRADMAVTMTQFDIFQRRKFGPLEIPGRLLDLFGLRSF